MEKRAKSPYIISLWSGYCSISLIIPAFVIVNGWLDDAVAAFGTLIFTYALSVSLGSLIGQALTRRPLHMKRLILLLVLASLLSAAPLVLGERFASHFLPPGRDHSGMAALIACLPFALPLFLLSMLPPYAVAILIRSRGSAGSVNRVVSLLAAAGYGIGAPTTTYLLVNGVSPWIALTGLCILSAIVTLLAFAKHPPRRIRKR